MTDPTTALAPVEAPPLPAMSGPQLVEQITRYKELQRELDRALPDTLIDIAGNGYRTKEYWKAIGLAFDVTVELVEEREHTRGDFADGRPNFGYLVLMRAVTRGGRSAIGDGACHAVEKAEAFKCPHPLPNAPRGSEWKRLHYPVETCPDFDPAHHWRLLPEEATDHNVRATAYTRATNRAIANLVAFGEVSAEEVQRGPADAPAAKRSSQSAAPARPRSGVISDAQRKRLWAIAKTAGWEEHEVRSYLGMQGIEHTDQIPIAKYDAIITALEAGVDGTREAQP